MMNSPDNKKYYEWMDQDMAKHKPSTTALTGEKLDKAIEESNAAAKKSSKSTAFGK